MEAKIHGDEVYLPAKKNRNKELDYKHTSRDFAKIQIPQMEKCALRTLFFYFYKTVFLVQLFLRSISQFFFFV
jgi:hypothetical protein